LPELVLYSVQPRLFLQPIYVSLVLLLLQPLDLPLSLTVVALALLVVAFLLLQFLMLRAIALPPILERVRPRDDAAREYEREKPAPGYQPHAALLFMDASALVYSLSLTAVKGKPSSRTDRVDAQNYAAH